MMMSKSIGQKNRIRNIFLVQVEDPSSKMTWIKSVSDFQFFRISECFYIYDKFMIDSAPTANKYRRYNMLVVTMKETFIFVTFQ